MVAVRAGPRTLVCWCGLGGGPGPATISIVGTRGGVEVQQPAHVRCCGLAYPATAIMQPVHCDVSIQIVEYGSLQKQYVYYYMLL